MNMECRMNLGVHWGISSATRIVSLLITDYQKQKKLPNYQKNICFPRWIFQWRSIKSLYPCPTTEICCLSIWQKTGL